MENLNKIISLILGLVVVIVFFAILSGRINLKNRLPRLGGATATPSPTSTLVRLPTPTIRVNITPTSAMNRYQTGKTIPPSSIPSTGVSSIFLPALFFTSIGGFFLKRKK